MIDPTISGEVGGQICVSVKEFASAMGGAQGQIITSAGTAMISFLVIGMIVGAAIATLFWYSKSRIDELQAGKDGEG